MDMHNNVCEYHNNKVLNIKVHLCQYMILEGKYDYGLCGCEH